MAWTAPITWVAQALTAALLNEQLRDNFNETAPGIASTAGRMIVTDAANSIVERIPTGAAVATAEVSSSTSFTDLATAGPAVTVVTGTTALVTVTGNLQNDTAGGISFMGYAVSSATTIAAATGFSLGFESNAAGDQLYASWTHLRTGLTAGSNVFTAKYSVSAGEGNWRHRFITVIPF